MPRLSRVKLIVNRKLFIVLLFLLFTIHYSLFTTPSPAFASPPDPKPCFNPIPTDNLTDNYITDDIDKGDPPDPQGNAVPDALKFTFIHSGPVGSQPGEMGTAVLQKRMEFTANFSKLQAIFGAPTSDYIEGRAQSTEHAQANLLAMKNPQLIKHQGPIGKTNPTAVTDDLRIKYVDYVNNTPTLAESKQEFSDYNGQNKKTINQLVQDYKTPTPPSPSDDRTKWISEWGKYWENIPTTYNEFYIGKLEFRPVHGTTAIKDLKDGKPGACFPNTALRIVEFPVPNFFRSAATSGVLNLAMLPKSAWSDQNDLLGIQGTVAGIKTSASDFIKNCFKFASNNPVTNAVKKVIKVSMQKLDEQYSVYAAVGASNLSTSNEACTASLQVNIKFNWTRQPNGAFFQADQQWLDLSTNAGDPFGAGNFINHDVFGQSSYSTTTAPGNIGPLLPGTTHYWRINTRSSLDNLWYESATGRFTTKDCPPPVPNGATNLSTANEACVSINQVNITFNWAPQPNGAFFTTGAQWLDLSTNAGDPFGAGNFINHDVFGASSYSTTTAPGNIGPLDANKTHYWRINTLNSLNNTWYPSATGTFTTKDCRPTIDPPVITRVGNIKNVTFTFSPPSDGNYNLYVYPRAVGAADVFHIDNISIGKNQVIWPDARWGRYKVVLLNNWLGKITPDPDVIFDIPYDLDQPVVSGRNVNFSWAPPIHIDPPDGTAMAIIVTREDGSLAWDSNGLPINSSTKTWQKAPPGEYQACLKYFIGIIETILDDDAHNCKTFSVSFLYSWTFFDLSDKSCIKVGNKGKAGNAPFCAIYPDKFETKAARAAAGLLPEQNILPTDNCNAGTSTIFKLNTDSNNVVCTFSFEWKSSDYNTLPGVPLTSSKSLRIPTTAEGDGNWDSCDEESGGFRTCYLTVGVWPDFRVPFLGQIWNNSLFSDTNEYLPTNQNTGRPGVYTLFQPKAVAEELAKDPIQIMIDKCASSPIVDAFHIPDGCNDLMNFGATHSKQYPGFEDCFGRVGFDPAKLIICFDLVAHSIIDNKLPGEVSGGGGVAGISTGGGSVLGENSGNQKERLIGAVDCGKHFSRDIALKPKALQQSLGIQQDCNLTASALPPSSNPGTPPVIEPPITPPGGDCTGMYTGVVNFGDPDCNFSITNLEAYLPTVDSDPQNVTNWLAIIPLESSYNPNAAAVAVNGTAYGLLQMDSGLNGQYDNGQVPWHEQISNAVNYNNNLAAIGMKWCYWEAAYPSSPIHPGRPRLNLVTFAQCKVSPF